jgi:hypothetical protein
VADSKRRTGREAVQPADRVGPITALFLFFFFFFFFFVFFFL